MPAKSTKSTKAKPALAAVSDATPADEMAGPAPGGAAPELSVISDQATAQDEADITADDPMPKGDAVKMKEFMAAVVNKSGAKRKDAKDVVEAVLAEIAAALSAGKALNLPPLGNLRVAKIQDKGGAKMMVLKLRMGGSGAGGKNSGADALAQDNEDS